MKKFLRIIVILAVILALLIPYTISYGADVFFEVASEEITVSDVIEATINIDAVSYNNFIFKLTADFDISETEVASDDETDEESEEETDENSETEIIVEDENEITISLNKSVVSVDTITLICALPDDISVGDTVTLSATIINSDNEEESENIIVTVTVVEETDNSISAESTENEYSDNLTEVGESSEEMMEMSEETSSMFSSSSFSSSESSLDFSSMSDDTSGSLLDSSSISDSASLSDTMESATYNGSDNCYLSELSVSSYELNKTFSKESTTYFVTIDDDVDSIDITATAEDDGATVCIYGSDNLTTGENKVLITVTAENGNTRTYRIYVTKS